MRLRPRLRPLALTLTVGLLVAGSVACGSDDDDDAGTGDSGGTTTAPPAGETDDGGGDAAGTIVAEDFSLTDLTVAPGTELVLDNQGSAPHTATADDGAFDLGQVGGGSTSDPIPAPDEPGDYPFHCEIHTDMTATLTVEG